MIGLVLGAGGVSSESISIICFIIGLILGWLYYAIMESSIKQATIGKSLVGIKVTDMNNNKISFGHATGRYFGKFISGITIGIGFLMAGLTSKKQGLHDIMAGTLVVNK